MKSDTLLALLCAFAPVFGFMCLGLGVLAGIAFLAFQSIRKAGNRPKELQESEAFFAGIRPRLRPWNPQALQNMAAYWRGMWASTRGLGFYEGYFQGLVLDLSDTGAQADGWIAFHLERPDLEGGRLCLQTSAHNLTLTFPAARKLIPSGWVTVTAEGAPFGKVHLPECTFCDAAGRQAGQVQRRRFGLRRPKGVYSPVVVHGRTLAEITDTWMRLPMHFEGKFYYTFSPLPAPWPALHDLRPNLSQEEERWLLTSIALELFFDSVLWRRGW